MNMQVRSLVILLAATFLFEAAKAQNIPDFALMNTLNAFSSMNSNNAATEYSKRVKKAKRHDFVIVFKNDSLIKAKASVEHIHDISFIMIGKKDDEMIVVKPDQTKLVTRQLSGGRRMPGIPFDKGWIFKTNNGPIYTYSLLPEEIRKEDEIIAIQKGDGPIVLFSVENLVAMIEPGSKAYSLAQKGDRNAIYIYNTEHQQK